MTVATKPKDDWPSKCQAFAERLNKVKDLNVIELRDAIALAHQLFDECPMSVRKRYARLDEAELREGAEEFAKLCDAEGLSWPREPFDPAESLADLALTVRALDILLRDYDDRRFITRRQPEQHWLTSDAAFYVIPLHSAHIPEASKLARYGYDKRGMFHHRVVPRIVEGMPVRLVLPRNLANASERRERLRSAGAAFPNLKAKLETKAEPGTFLFEEVSVANFGGLLESQIAAMDGCDFCLWPELTINDDALATIVSALKAKAIRTLDCASFVLAGSWHRKDEEGVMRNRLPILTGNGRQTAWYSKIAIYGDSDVGFERVEEGSELLVLVGDGFLATVGICKDFSDLQDSNPWVRLPVDIVLIISMGDHKTMAGHLVRAQELRRGHGRLTYIIQQGLWGHHKEPKNYLLPAPNEVATDCGKAVFDDNFAVGETGS